AAYGAHAHLPSFPTRRSSDLHGGSFTFEEQTKEITMKSYVPSIIAIVAVACAALVMSSFVTPETPVAGKEEMIADWERAKAYTADRKSTRLNSSHVKISYAVF